MDVLTSNLEDPFLDSSLLSFFPRTFTQRDLHPHRDSLQTDSLEAVRPILDSMAMNPNKLTEQAKSVLDRLKVDNRENTRGEDAFGGVIRENLQGQVENVENVRDEATAGVENQKTRRPGLGMKRPRFSLKPKPSQSIQSLAPDVDVDKYPDPVEYFAAFERNENARKELRKHLGPALVDLDQNVPLRSERQRRPGLPGFSGKKVNYTERFRKALSRDFLPSQEAVSQDLCSPTPSTHSMQIEKTDTIPVPSTRELSGPMAAGRGGFDDIIDEVQSDQDNDDESDDIIAMVKERYKPIQINESCLPDVDSVLQSEFKKIWEEGAQAISDFHGGVSAIGKEITPGCNNMGRRSSGHPLTSLMPPKSPFSSIPLLTARLYQSRKEKDPFSVPDIEFSPLAKVASGKDTRDLSARDLENSVKGSKNIPNISPVTIMHIDSGHATGGNDTAETNPNESECNVASKDVQNLAAAKFTSSEKSINSDSIIPAVLPGFIDHMEVDHDIAEHGERDITPNSPLHEKESEDIFAIRRDQSPKSAAHEKESNVVHSKGIHDLDAENIVPSKEIVKENSTISGIALDTTPHAEFDHNIMAYDATGTVLEDNPREVFDPAAMASDQYIEQDGRVEEGDVQHPHMENLSCNKEQSTASNVEDLEMDRRSSNNCKVSTEGAICDLDQDRPSSSQTRPLKKTRKASSKTMKDMSSKAIEPSHKQLPAERRIAKAAPKHRRERQECDRRKSLAACGTELKEGKRRSTRIRSRPLEFWKGERQLYGRIHESLITVIGTKYFSPSKETGQATLKVKSYVSDEYKEIVELAAMH